jgi:hypothetical protein
MKEFFVVNMYLIMFALIDLGVLCIGDNLIWLKLILCGAVLVAFVIIVGLFIGKEAETAVRVRRGNDLNREHIIKTGKDMPLNLAEEYKPWKGFAMGAMTCIPLLVFMGIQLLVKTPNPELNPGGAISAFLYMVVFSFFRVDSRVDILPADYNYIFLAIPRLILTIGISYIVGAKIAAKKHERFLAGHRKTEK